MGGFAVRCCVIAVALSTAAGSAIADGDYVAIRLIGGVSSIGSTSANASGLQIEQDSDEVAGAGIALGYDWSAKGLPIRSELAYHHRFRFDYNNRIIGASSTRYENNLSTHAVLVNAVYDIDIGSSWTPYAGGGVGWARHWSGIERQTPVGTVETRDDATDNFIWSVMAGVTYKFAENWDFEVGYRYIQLGDVNRRPFGDGVTLSGTGYTSHDLILGALYRF